MATQVNNSVVKAFAILDLFSESRTEINAALVSRELGLNAVTAHRFLRTLEQVGALVAVSKGVYRLGFALVDLADRVIHHAELGRALLPVLEGITADMREASMATAFEADMVVCIARVVSGRSLSVDIRVGTQLDAYCTAHGKLWLSELGEPALRRYLEVMPLARLAPHTIVDRDRLLAELDLVRRQGHAVNDGEREEGIRAVAVPVRTRQGRMVAGLSLFGPAFRLTDPVMAAGLERLRAAAVEAGQLLQGPAATSA
ncbi:IclR family transcriptional regulator [Marinibaculum pumilum]|uniref:IclR family transcriptional regulator n=1 Tax=Marinibaculum pumilum TaxID=1766165 RepID=A0ABV7L6E4_9PROT